MRIYAPLRSRALVGAGLFVVVSTAALLPFGARNLGASVSFMPAMLAVVASFDVISVMLLLGDFYDSGDRRTLALAFAYMWSLALMGGYALAFPDVVGIGPPLASSASVAPWLYIGWHGGFPVLLGLAAAPWPRRWQIPVDAQHRARAAVTGAAAIAGVGVAAVAALVLVGPRLPVLIVGSDTSRMTTLTAPVVLPLVVLSVVSGAHRARQRGGPERWAAVTVLVCLCDLILTYAAHARYTVGWYAGRTLTLVAAGTVLMAMLADFYRVKATAQRSAAYDDLTGLLNRRMTYESLHQLIARAERSGTPLSVLAIDLDRFKLVNDQHGHAAGDRVLHEVGAAFAANVRRGDVVGRVGGEEFLVLLPDTPVDGALTLAQKVRVALATLEVARDIGVVTASIGVSQLGPGETAEDMLRRADSAMYEAKQAGRDAVTCDQSAPPTPSGPKRVGSARPPRPRRTPNPAMRQAASGP